MLNFKNPRWLSTVTNLESSVFALFHDCSQSWIPVLGLLTLPKQMSPPTPCLSEASRPLYKNQQLSSNPQQQNWAKARKSKRKKERKHLISDKSNRLIKYSEERPCRNVFITHRMSNKSVTEGAWLEQVKCPNNPSGSELARMLQDQM